METRSGNFLPWASLPVLFLACVPLQPQDQVIARNNCPIEACGLNGPHLADRILGELDLDGMPGSAGLAIVEFLSKDGRSLELDIAGAEFIGRERETGIATLAGGRLVGAEIVLERQADDGALSEWRVRIDGVHGLARMSTQGGEIPAYRLSYRPTDSGGQFAPLCPDGASALVITGERYDVATLAILPQALDDRRFRLACKSDALAKAKLMSYDPALPAGHRYHTDPAQRRATLAMLTADYCGTGFRFAKPGNKLLWRNRADWMVVGRPDERPLERAAGRATSNHPTRSAIMEAVWNERGAVCLNTPRPGTHDGRADIEAVCGRSIPRCSPALEERGEWITWLPQSIR